MFLIVMKTVLFAVKAVRRKGSYPAFFATDTSTGSVHRLAQIETTGAVLLPADIAGDADNRVVFLESFENTC
jgi:hypothetical protein